MCGDAEEGLLGVTVDPQFATNGFIYLYYTGRRRLVQPARATPSGGAVNRVSRFTMTGNTVARSSEHVLLDNMPEWGGNHNGGYVHVAHDGTLFVSVGDGGAGRPDTNPADLSLPNGKILRINTDGSIPAGNPHGTTVCGTTWGTPGATCGEIYADGLRNPFRLAFDDDVPGVTSSASTTSATPPGKRSTRASPAPTTAGRAGKGRRSHASSRACNMPITDPVALVQPLDRVQRHHRPARSCPAGAWQGYDDAYLFADNGCGKHVRGPARHSGRRLARRWPPASTASPTWRSSSRAARTALFYTTYAGGGQLHKVDRPAAAGAAARRSPTPKFSALQPTRVLDTRNGTGVGRRQAGRRRRHHA